MKKSIFSTAKPAVLGLLAGVALSAAFAFKVIADRPNCSISLDKMNVFYIGVDNPVSIVVSGVPANQVVATGKNIDLKKMEGREDKYIVRAKTPGEASIEVSGGNGTTWRFMYRVKRIPDPIPLLGARHRSKSMGNGEFKAQGGIAAVLENYDFDARCEIIGFKATYISPRQDPVEKSNPGGRFTSEVADMVNKAKPGDVYFFDEIKARCPGDTAGRELGSLVFKIK